MKTIEEIKNEVAIKYGYKEWSYIPERFQYLYVNEVAIYYSEQCCDEQIQACHENAELEVLCQHGYGAIKQDSILNTPNVVTIKTK